MSELPAGSFEQIAAALLANQHGVRFRPAGMSMAPTIRDGEAVIVEPLSGPPRLGDIVLVIGARGLLAHRVARRRGENFVTRGDSAREEDPQVKQEDILGRVVAVERNGTTIRLDGRVAALRQLFASLLYRARRSLGARLAR